MVSGQLHTPPALPLGNKSPDAFYRGGCVGYRTTWKDLQKKKILSPAGNRNPIPY
jgi:hypothetical protein